MEAKIGISTEHLAAVAESMNKILADEFVLYTKTRKAHWCLEGPDFFNKHKFFEEQYSQLEEFIDEIAERIRMLGHFPAASLKEYLRLTHLTEETREPNTGEGYIKSLLSDHESIIIHLRENIKVYVTAYNDAGNSDYITSLMEKHEKMAWILRSHIV